jgi:hypothetical protein
MEEINKIKEFVKKHDKDWVADWNCSSQFKCYIFFAHIQKEYRLDWTRSLEVYGAIYMSERCAKLLIRKLNRDEITL